MKAQEHPGPLKSGRTQPIVKTSLSGRALLNEPFLNKGTAFPADERETFGLLGLLPHDISTVENQLKRTYNNFISKHTDVEKNIFLEGLHDRNETLFFRLVQNHIAEMVPIIYTPTVGQACENYSHRFRRPRGTYLSYPDRERISQILDNVRQEIEVIVVTDGERILGLGDLGAGGIGIPIGKLALYTVCAGINPSRGLPVILDVGTNNPELLRDPLYLGWHHERLGPPEYDDFVKRFVRAAKKRWPKVLLQWEDFSKGNAARLLHLYQKEISSFNDDIQGTAAVTVAGLIRATQACGKPLSDQRILILGAGSAATGIAELSMRYMRKEGVDPEAAKKTVWLVDTKGLVHEGRSDLSVEKKPFAQPVDRLRQAGLDPSAPIDFAAAVRAFKATVLIGVSGQPGVFKEDIVRAVAGWTDRPIIFPLSNPTSKCEARPGDLIAWTEGRALIATGSPFPPVPWEGASIPIGQCNNTFIFPGLGLGLVVTQAKEVPEEAFLAAARTLAEFNERLTGFDSSLFPNLELVRKVSGQIAVSVAREVVRLGLANRPIAEADIFQAVHESMWEPVYPKLVLSNEDSTHAKSND